MSLRWTERDFEDWRLRKGPHADPAPQEEAPASDKTCSLAGSRKIGTKAHRQMNKWEAKFAQTLEYRKHAGELVWWAFEPIRIRLANGTFYRPDFVTVDKAGRTEVFEVKGYFREAARIRLKVAVEKLPYRFYLVRQHKGELQVVPV